MTPRADPPLPAWPVRLIDDLNAADRRAIDVARGLGPEQINWKPDAGVWSVGQCLQHLLVANEVYQPAISRALDDRRSSPLDD